MHRINWIKIAIAGAAATFATAASANTLNLTGYSALGTPATSGTINGAFFQSEAIHPAGTGVYDPFLTIQRNGSEQGYNTSADPTQFDEKRLYTWTHPLQLSTLAVVKNPLTQVDSYAFMLDINEADPTKKSLLSLDALQIYRAPVGNYGHLDTTAHTFSDGPSTLVYDLDSGGNNTVLLDYAVISTGSGSSDLGVYIPKSAFIGSGDFIYLYSRFGLFTQSGFNFTSDAGFEEWRAVQSLTPPPPPPSESSTPLPSAASAGLALISIVAARRTRRGA